MRSLRRRGALATVFTAVVVLAAACTGNDAGNEDGTIDPAVPSGTVAVPAERLTPFCQAMIDLSNELETDPPVDVAGLILETYLAVADVVPSEIADDFNAVLAGLQGKPVPTVVPDSVPELPPPPTDDPANTLPPVTNPVDGSVVPPGDAGFDEGRFNSDTPSQRLNDYVKFACRDSDNNPGPAATQPLDDIVPPTTAE